METATQPQNHPFSWGQGDSLEGRGKPSRAKPQVTALKGKNAEQGTSLGLLHFLLINGKQDLRMLAPICAFHPQHLTSISFLSKEPKVLEGIDLLHALSVVM